MRFAFEATLLVILCILCVCDAVIVHIEIKNSTYQIQGNDITSFGQKIYYFAKIPYAKPPIGNRRFQYPEELDVPPWRGVYDSTAPPFTCWQGYASSDFDLKNPAAKMWFSKTNMSEDCLYLTIWTPSIDSSSLLPVMVWIYGGSYMSGSNTLEVYDGSFLASLHKVVIVSFQFRIGPFGLLFMDHSESPGNQAIMDQRLAFKWVKKHIKSFGGNPNLITLFGESSGATSISIHLFSPMTNNLFEKAILQSGTIFVPWAIESSSAALIKGKFLAEKANCSSFSNYATIQCLRNVPPEDLVNYNFLIRNQMASFRKAKLEKEDYRDFYSDAAMFFDIYFRPIYDEKIISKMDVERITEGRLVTNKELLIGTNSNEAVFFLMYGLSSYFNFFNSSLVQLPMKMNYPSENFIDPYKIVLENVLDLEYMYPSIAKLILHEYNIQSTWFDDNSWTSKDIMAKLDLIGGDTQFICPTLQFADSVTKSESTKLFMYLFNCRTSQSPVPDWLGIMHGYEIEYVFGMPFSQEFTKKYYSFKEDEKETSKLVMEMWTNFAKYGNPTPENFKGKISWPAYTPRSKQYLKISSELYGGLTVQNNLKAKQCRFWTKIIPSLINSLLKKSNGCSALLSEGVVISLIVKAVAAVVALLITTIN